MEAAVAHQIWNYISMLGVDRETARDLYQEAQAAVWQAAERRATRECHSYLVKTGIGAIRHWLRDKYCLIRIPGYLHDRGQASEHVKTIVPLDEVTETSGLHFEEDLLDHMSTRQKRSEIEAMLHLLTGAERAVIAALLQGRSIGEIARERRVRVGCIYSQRSKAIDKLRRLLQAELAQT
jgi:RNA polymerase sigma factor (sigma-70 family)